MTAAFPPRIGDRYAGRYSLRKLLRGAGAAQTYLAFDHETGREVAVQLFDPASCTDASWAAYARVVAAAAAANIGGLVLQSVPRASRSSWVVDGSLADRGFDRIRVEDGPIPWQRAFGLGERVAEILHNVHLATGIAHRALTPSRCSEGAEIKVWDYGVAELESAEGRREGADYWAPEQARGRGDHRSDVWSLAAILFEMITGQRPSPKIPAHLLSIVPNIPPPVDDVMARALARDPARRFADLSGLRTAILAVVGMPQHRAPPTPALSRLAAAADPQPVPTRTPAPAPVTPLVEKVHAPIQRDPAPPPVANVSTSPAQPSPAPPPVANGAARALEDETPARDGSLGIGADANAGAPHAVSARKPERVPTAAPTSLVESTLPLPVMDTSAAPEQTDALPVTSRTPPAASGRAPELLSVPAPPPIERVPMTRKAPSAEPSTERLPVAARAALALGDEQATLAFKPIKRPTPVAEDGDRATTVLVRDPTPAVVEPTEQAPALRVDIGAAQPGSQLDLTVGVGMPRPAKFQSLRRASDPPPIPVQSPAPASVPEPESGTRVPPPTADASSNHRMLILINVVCVVVLAVLMLSYALG